MSGGQVKITTWAMRQHAAMRSASLPAMAWPRHAMPACCRFGKFRPAADTPCRRHHPPAMAEPGPSQAGGESRGSMAAGIAGYAVLSGIAESALWSAGLTGSFAAPSFAGISIGRLTMAHQSYNFRLSYRKRDREKRSRKRDRRRACAHRVTRRLSTGERCLSS